MVAAVLEEAPGVLGCNVPKRNILVRETNP